MSAERSSQSRVEPSTSVKRIVAVVSRTVACYGSGIEQGPGGAVLAARRRAGLRPPGEAPVVGRGLLEEIAALRDRTEISASPRRRTPHGFTPAPVPWVAYATGGTDASREALEVFERTRP